MGSPLGPTLANAFLCFHEQIWLNECPDEFKPAYYRRYVDDIFVLFRSPDHLEKFKNYLSSKCRNIRFICKKEQNNFFFRRFNYQNQQWFQNICVSQTHI